MARKQIKEQNQMRDIRRLMVILVLTAGTSSCSGQDAMWGGLMSRQDRGGGMTAGRMQTGGAFGMSQNVPYDTASWPRDTEDPFKNQANWEAFDAGSIGGLETKGYFGIAYDGRYIYYAPCRMRDFHGIAMRYDTQKPFKSDSSWESYDAGMTDGMSTKGYAGAVCDGRYVYFVPLLADRQRHARVLRFDSKGAFTSESSWAAFDGSKVGGSEAAGYCGAAFDGRRVYFAPFGYKPKANSIVLAYDATGDFRDKSSWSSFDVDGVGGMKARGFYGAVTAGSYVYFVPFNDGDDFHGKVLRYNTRSDFDAAKGWQAYDAGKTSGLRTVGYKGAAFDGRYVYFVPFRDSNDVHGRVLRYDTESDFENAGSWKAYDAGNTDGLDTRGFVGAAFDGRYVYFVPYSGDGHSYHARMLRFDTKADFGNAASWSAVDAGSIDGLATRGYKYAVYDGRYMYYTPYHNGISMFSGVALRFDTKGPVWDGKTPIKTSLSDSSKQRPPMSRQEMIKKRREMIIKRRQSNNVQW